MRIAFASHEYPPETGGGGIGTYLVQISRALAEQGHAVALFAGSTGSASTTELPGGAILHRIATRDSQSFAADVVAPFASEHHRQGFDVIEGADFDASAVEIKRALPDLPYVVKLHTPRFVIDELHHTAPSRWQHLRMTLGAWRRGRALRSVPIRAQWPAQQELDALRLADHIAAPSHAIADAARKWTDLDPARFSVFPLPFVPSPALLQIAPATASHRVTFIGRLEERKGVIDLADAIPLVLARNPQARFRFVGRSMPHGPTKLMMQSFLEARLSRHGTAVEFTGAIPAEKIPAMLAETDLLVAPSHWESFGLVCCEGLAAARAVIGSASGGMVDILQDGGCGRLVPPHQPVALADAISHLLAHPAERQRLGVSGRQHLLDHYSLAQVLPKQVASYEAAIQRCQQEQQRPN